MTRSWTDLVNRHGDHGPAGGRGARPFPWWSHDELGKRVADLTDLALAIQVTDAASADMVGQYSKEIRALKKAIDDNRKEVKEPWLRVTQRIARAPKACTKKLDDTHADLQRRVGSFLAEEQRKADELARQEQARVKALADAEEARLREERARKPENKEAATKAAEEAQSSERDRTAASPGDPGTSAGPPGCGLQVDPDGKPHGGSTGRSRRSRPAHPGRGRKKVADLLKNGQLKRPTSRAGVPSRAARSPGASKA